MQQRSAFTLIELLIVVAIIAILAAIAVPNFLEAQTRARVSRAENDMRSIALSMESYLIDNGGYPAGVYSDTGVELQSGCYYPRLTTPITYIASYPSDVFMLVAGASKGSYRLYAVGYVASSAEPFYYRSFSQYPRTAWMTWSLGPDLVTNADGYRPYGRVVYNESLPTASQQLGKDRNGNYVCASGSYWGMRYDPTNGTVSYGDIYRFEGLAKNRIN